MSRSHAMVLAMVVLAGGCTLLNAPDRGLLDAGEDAFVVPDGGVDGNVDAGPDAGDADTDASSCVVHAESDSCGNRQDDDCDGLVDCADPDCVRVMAAECCDSGRATTIEDSFTSLLPSAWQRASGLPAVAFDAVQDFGSGPLVGMVRQDMGTAACLEAELGTSLSFELHALSCAGAACEGHAEVVLGPSSEFRAGSSLQDDLGIRGTNVGGSLQIDVTRGGTVVATRATGLGARPIRVDVALALGVVDGTSAIVATITLDRETVPFVDNLFVVARRDVRTDLCPGLFLGIQGTGNHVTIDTLSITQLDCSNPSRVDPSDGIPQLTATTFSALDWASGGIGSPAILARDDADVSLHLMVLFDGSLTDRGSAGLARLPLSIGGGDLRSGGAMTANCNDWLPRAGIPDPTCGVVPEGVDPLVTALPRAMQDPAMAALDATNVLVLWAGERSESDRALELHADSLFLVPGRTRTLSVSPPLAIAAETCRSIHSPQIVPLVGGAAGEWLLFYICDSHPSEVHAARGTLASLARVEDIVLGPNELGPSAEGGVSDMAAVVFQYAGQPTYRLWLLTHGPAGAVLSFAEGTAAPGGTPTFLPYAGNPILQADEPDLGPCLGRCELHGVAATRVPGVPTLVQLLIERWDTGSATAPYALIPLRQSWPSD